MGQAGDDEWFLLNGKTHVITPNFGGKLEIESVESYPSQLPTFLRYEQLPASRKAVEKSLLFRIASSFLSEKHKSKPFRSYP